MPSKIYWTCTESYPVVAKAFCAVAERLNSAGFPVETQHGQHQVTFCSATLGRHAFASDKLSGHFTLDALAPLAGLLCCSAYAKPTPVLLLAHQDGRHLSMTALRTYLAPLVESYSIEDQTRLFAIAGMLSMTEITTIFRDQLSAKSSHKRRVDF